MLKETVSPMYTKKEAAHMFEGVRPTYALARSLNIRFVSAQDIEFRTPDGELIACLLTDVFDEDEQQRRWDVFRQVKGDPSNRPEIFGSGARMQKLRTDGTPSPRIGVPASVAVVGGQGATLGPYRRPASHPGEINCELTGWTLQRPDIYIEAIKLAAQVTEIYKSVLPVEYEQQMRYVDAIAKEYRMAGSAYTNLYALKNRPTAFHVDEFDVPTSTGCLSSAGSFGGCELVLPEFGLAFDLQPSDLLFVDVHRLHGNLPKRWGSRVSQVFFVRRGQHECGQANDGWAFQLGE